jgi:nicotinate dehydrogenase subunit A
MGKNRQNLRCQGRSVSGLLRLAHAMPVFEIPVNAQWIVHHGQPSDRLLEVLHDHALTATKLGCGAGHCGACTVWLNGRPTRSCELTVDTISVGSSDNLDSAGGVEQAPRIVTLEGLAQAEPRLARCLEDAFCSEQAAQCGYCSSGILMKAAALIKDHALRSGAATHPSLLDEADVARALDEHLCRCGSHRRVLRAVLLASKNYLRDTGSNEAPPSQSKLV